MVNSFQFYGDHDTSEQRIRLYPRLGLITNKPHGQRLTTNYFVQTNTRAIVLLYCWV